MGAGKTSVGIALARLTGLPRYDTDLIVSKKFGMPITEVFAQFGSERFRAEETEALRLASPDKKMIVITGGGTVLEGENVELLKALGIIVQLDADEETLFKRISARSERPLLNTNDPRKTMSELLQKRRPLYEAVADLRVDTSALRGEAVAREIIARVDTF